MAFKRVGKYWFSWGKVDGFTVGICVSRYFITIDLFFWYVGLEF